MFKELDILKNNIVDVRANFSKLVAQAGAMNSEELADINVSQMDSGIDGDGKALKPDYSPSYAKFKGFKTPNLKVTGDYHSSIDVENKNGRLLFFSDDEGSDKVSFLEDHYDNKQYGIAPQNEQKAADEIDEDLTKIVENEITKGI